MDLTSFRTLGRSGLVVSPFALGTMTFGAGRWGTEEEGARAILDAYAEAGGNFVDTADIYGGGASEEMLGRWVAERGLRDRAREDDRARLLMTTPGVGVIVALTYVAAMDDPGRFGSPAAPPPARHRASPRRATATAGPPRARRATPRGRGRGTRRSALPARSPPSPRARSAPWRPPRTRCSVPARRRSRHSAPWSSLDDAWGRPPGPTPSTTPSL